MLNMEDTGDILSIAAVNLHGTTDDGVHFTEQGHKAFAAGLLEVLR